MKYFRIYRTCDEKIIGVGSQITEGLYPTTFDSYRGLYMYSFKKVNKDVEIPKAILSKKAKLVDIISASFLSAGQFFISNKLQNIFSNYLIEGLEFLPTSIIFQNKEIKDFWITNPYQSSFSFLDVLNSEFAFTDSMGSLVKEVIKFKDVNEYLEAFEKNKLDAIKIGYPNFKPLAINKIVLKKDITIAAFSIIGVYGGIGIFVSEMLKNKIEEAGCTGIVFTDVNHRYP